MMLAWNYASGRRIPIVIPHLGIYAPAVVFSLRFPKRGNGRIRKFTKLKKFPMLNPLNYPAASLREFTMLIASMVRTNFLDFVGIR